MSGEEEFESTGNKDTASSDEAEEIPDLMDEIHESERLSRLIAFREGR